jgi:hypothetical protein
MQRELLDKWVAALRGGKYQQGKLQLRDGDRFCCLGVLCEVMGLERQDDGYVTPDGAYYEGMLRYARTHGPHKDLRDSLGLSVSIATNEYTNTPFDFYLMHLNDQDNKSFAQIADVIEEYRDRFETGK